MPKFKNQDLHYDIVGSFLRPKNLKRARLNYHLGNISRNDLTQIEDADIAKLVQKEKQNGLKIVTDGEFRRSWWHLDTFWGFNGIAHVKDKHGYQFHGEETRKDSARVSGKISFNPGHPDLKAYRYLHNLISDDPDIVARQSIPSPAQLFNELIRGPENIKALEKYYSNLKDLIHDVGKAYHDLIIALYNSGCRDVKLDDCTWATLCDPSFHSLIDKLAKKSSLKIDWPKLIKLNLVFNNEAIKDLPKDLVVNTHSCRGNYDSHWAAQGGYEPVAKELFGKENVDNYYLEYDTKRSGDFKPLQYVNGNKGVVLGLVTTKKPELESQQHLIHRIHEATKYVPLDRLSISPQCGFSSTEEGNHLTEAQQWAKIRLVVDTAKKVWN
ncbi:5-methyltetrahydropteroyltriglutamate--homocysteine S-methyltransferase [Acetilactobacillus jinshanensis]|uniref:5-methyltetrahydropteroyltriglutamate--homocysteine S-methyltransferase n=1 Tax=Acetilactobacillus jinshanensis TaxID=1720083 RepID=A0A4P6ZKX6_9LACO|nr:5-methyltetrahydropteroyltriglutamate--homocysteine S-methyltransferase [Acetilactobacillus jinshanensis]QBP18426.1 5-methyltetrahydropteroyltriglutamate--homocysteine S-methyltransferase [Acetilactobacillus jinshanensis]URL61298.1 5-methyltetrahydropteroyltriglutamate--homocysteine S-methyltransferase [uncultured bacterium]